MKFSYLFLLILVFISCSQENAEPITDKCFTAKLNNTINYNGLVQDISEELISLSVEKPNDLGALGRNKEGYFHVRFQFEMSSIVDYAVRFESEEAVRQYIKNLSYSFSFQKQEGDFEIIPPTDLVNSPDYKEATQGDLASGVSFFAYSLGVSLNTLKQSAWYNNSVSTSLKDSINSFAPKVQKMIVYLKQSKVLLEQYDKTAPNRLLIDAYAFYSLGNYLNDNELKEIGIQFAKEAIAQTDSTRGFFIEGGGWDSSYNGVALKIGFEFYTLIDRSEISLLEDLEKTLTCAVSWQKSRILDTGEISAEGNTRVSANGETFLGKKKDIDIEKTIKSFLYMSTLSSDDTYKNLAMKVLDFYR